MSLYLSAKAKRSYPELEGQHINWYNSKWNNGSEVDSIILGCDYHIGVTIVNAEDTTDNLTCMNGPLSPRFKDRPMTRKQLIIYNKKFKLVLLMIAEGFYDADIKRQVFKESKYPSGQMNNCSFV